MFIDSFQTSWEGKKLKSTILKNQNLSYITISKNMTLIKLWQYWTSYLMTYKQISVWLEHVSQTDLCLSYIVNALTQNNAVAEFELKKTFVGVDQRYSFNQIFLRVHYKRTYQTDNMCSVVSPENKEQSECNKLVHVL